MARLLLLRPQPEADRSAGSLRRLGHAVVVAPIASAIATGVDTEPGKAAAVLLTSARAIDALSADAAASIGALPAFAVGEATAAAARARGFRQVTAAAGNAGDLAATVAATLVPPAPLLFLAGEPRLPTLERALAGAGFAVETRVVYRMAPAETLPEAARLALEQGTLAAVLHYSHETARLFVRLAGEAGLAAAARRPVHLCLSPHVAAGLEALDAPRVRIAATPREDALFALAMV